GVSAQQCAPCLRQPAGAASGQRASAAPGGGNGSVSCRWRGDGSHPERRAYLRSSAPLPAGIERALKDTLQGDRK
ncbi:hypothetical protein OA807_23020, partial [Citrobacter freundii]